MKIAALKRFFAIVAVGLSCLCCSSDLDFDQVNTIKLEPVFIANLAFFDVPAPDFLINGAEQNIVFDVATKKILLQEKITGRPQGGSVKTYWAGAFREALEKNVKVYKKWKKGAMVK